MSVALKMISRFFDSKGIKYRVEEENRKIRVVYDLDNVNDFVVNIFVDNDDAGVAVRSFYYVKFPANKAEAMYKKCSEINGRFRWIKFYVDDDDNTVTLAVDGVIQLDSCGEEVYELMGRMLNIADDAYPEFMKVIWS